MTVKKYILILIAAIALPFASKAQNFIEGSVGYIPFEINMSDLPSHGGISMQFQYGKFVNNYKMRSVSFGVRRVGLQRDDINYTSIDGVPGNYHSTISSSVTALNLGYERKVTFANTEFDDTWQYYSIVNYHLTMFTVSETFSDPSIISQDDKYAGTYFSPDIEFGLGMGRKFAQKAYAYSEARLYMPFLEGLVGYSGFGVRINFGVRYFLR